MCRLDQKCFFLERRILAVIVTCFTKKGWSSTRIAKEYLNKMAQKRSNIPKH